jgi:hypothetical protein
LGNLERLVSRSVFRKHNFVLPRNIFQPFTQINDGRVQDGFFVEDRYYDGYVKFVAGHEKNSDAICTATLAGGPYATQGTL